MRLLVADDDPMTRRLAQAALEKAGYDVMATGDGGEACRVLCGDDPPLLAILDWIMPGMHGVDVCRRVRQQGGTARPYLILLTSKDRTEDIVEGLAAGADDYVAKPFTVDELRARVQVGTRILDLQAELRGRVRELEQALGRVGPRERPGHAR